MTIQHGDHYLMINIWHHNDRRDKTTFSNHKNMTTWGPQRKYDGPAREKERELVNANDMNENFCVFADSMEKLDHHPVAKKYTSSGTTWFCLHWHIFATISLVFGKIHLKKGLMISKYSKRDHGTRKGDLYPICLSTLLNVYLTCLSLFWEYIVYLYITLHTLMIFRRYVYH